jgi:hypothetical protein
MRFNFWQVMSTKSTILLMLIVVTLAPVPTVAVTVSRVYVDAYPCADMSGKRPDSPGVPVVTLFDRTQYGDANYKGSEPVVAVTKSSSGESNFYFDIPAGNYHAFVSFPSRSRAFMANGPLVVISGHDRHLVIGGCHFTDWHDVAAIAGSVPFDNIAVSVLVFDHSMRCGDDFRALDQTTLKPLASSQETSAIVDHGAYYATFHGYGRQDRTVALLFSGAFFTEGAILVASTPDTPAHKPPLILKDLTPTIIQAAMRNGSKLLCVQGF